ncbi:MAG: YhcH/YjgK/YiaL family protein [Betaproteobacteria bacterium]
MIVTDLKHIDHQVMMTPALKKAIDFLRLRGIHDLPDGRVEIDGNEVFAIVQRYETIKAAAPKFEYHRKYIDIQFIVSGEEIIGWAQAEHMTTTQDYDPDKDICFGTAEKGKWTPVHLQAGQLAVLWPEDGHAPKVAAGGPSRVMKIVVKVAV